MSDEFDFLIALLILGALAQPILWGLAIVGFYRTGVLRGELTALRLEIVVLRGVGSAAPVVEEAPAPAPATLPEAAPLSPTEPAAPAPESPAPIPDETVLAATDGEVEAVQPAASDARLESSLTGRWTVWLGGLVLALGGVFLVKYSIEQGLFGPGPRVVAGLALGIALIVAALRLRHAGAAASASAVAADYVPASLIAAGVAVLFATIYAAYALYFFIPPLLAFVALAGVAALAALLSLLFGQFIALLGLAGAFLVPLLVATDSPSAFGLFGYLFIIALGALALVRSRGWWWLAHVTLALSALWTIFWLAVLEEYGGNLVVGAYLTLLAGAMMLASRDATAGDGAGAGGVAARQLIGWLAAATTSLLMIALAIADQAAMVTLIETMLLCALFIATGLEDPRFDRLSWVAAGLASGVIATWTLAISPPLFPAMPHDPIFPPAAARLFIAASCFAAYLGLTGFVVQRSAPHPGRWAAGAAAAPVAMLALLYWRLAGVGHDMNWTLLGLGLAAAYLAAAQDTAKRREQPGIEVALAAYAIGLIAALALAATMALERAWLSVALALMLPGIAWVGGRTGVLAVRPVAAILAVIVLVRLLLNPSLLDYPIESAIFNWLTYGYGIPSIAFAVAAHLFRRDREDYLTQILEGGAIALALALVTLELRQLFGGDGLASSNYSFAEASLQSDAWLLAALIRLYRARQDRRPLQIYAWRIIGGAALLHLVFYLLLIANPLWTEDSVGETPIFNLVFVAYAVPVFIAVPFLLEARRQGETIAAAIAGIAAVLLGFVAVSLEVRQWFQGGILSVEGFSDAEGYAYSLAWLLYGAALLGLGIWTQQIRLRLAGLAFLTLTVGKAFLFDMANLAGLYRAASFVGLGLSLIAIGYLYQLLAAKKSPPPGRA